jgi:hypothetical protein
MFWGATKTFRSAVHKEGVRLGRTFGTVKLKNGLFVWRLRDDEKSEKICFYRKRAHAIP